MELHVCYSVLAHGVACLLLSAGTWSCMFVTQCWHMELHVCFSVLAHGVACLFLNAGTWTCMFVSTIRISLTSKQTMNVKITLKEQKFKVLMFLL